MIPAALPQYLAIVRRHLLIVLAVPVLAMGLSAIVAWQRPPLYRTEARLLVTRSAMPPASSAGLTPGGEDTVALDLPAIVAGEPFARDVARELSRRGYALEMAQVRAALSATAQEHVVVLAATAAQPALAVALVDVAIDLIRRNGLHYWGDPYATPDHPGVRVAVLDPPAPATQIHGPRAIAIELAARGALGLAAGAGLAFVLHALAPRRGSAG